MNIGAECCLLAKHSLLIIYRCVGMVSVRLPQTVSNTGFHEENSRMRGFYQTQKELFQRRFCVVFPLSAPTQALNNLCGHTS
jgi:hypothetical protein